MQVRLVKPQVVEKIQVLIKKMAIRMKLILMIHSLVTRKNCRQLLGVMPVEHLFSKSSTGVFRCLQ